MYGFLKGEIINVEQGKSRVLIRVLNTGIGLFVTVHFSSYHSSFYKVGSEISLFIFHHKTEYAETLFGFLDYKTKLIFESVHAGSKGISIKSIFSIINEYQIDDLTKLKKLTLEEIRSIKGVGVSGAKKIMLSISQVVKNDIDLQTLIEGSGSGVVETPFQAEINALKSMGVSDIVIKDYLSRNSKRISEDKLQPNEFIKEVLNLYKR